MLNRNTFILLLEYFPFEVLLMDKSEKLNLTVSLRDEANNI